MKNKKAFTLVELLATIVILGILLLIAVPSVSKIITKSKKEAFVKNAMIYINQAKTLSFDENQDLITYDLSQLGQTTTSPFGGNLSGKVAATKNKSTGKYEYSIYMEDNNNILGDLTINSLPIFISEDNISANSIKSREEIVKAKNLKYSECNINRDSLGCQNYNFDLEELLAGLAENQNQLDNESVVLIMGKSTDQLKLYPEYAKTENENFKYAIGNAVTVKLKDSGEKQYFGGTIIRRIDENYFDVVLDEDLYPNDTSSNQILQIERISQIFKQRYMKSTTPYYWKNVQSVRLLSISDINYFASILGDNGKISCTKEGCINTIEPARYLNILSKLNVGNKILRRWDNSLCTENCNSSQDAKTVNFVNTYYHANTWLTDDNLCKFDPDKLEFKVTDNKCTQVGFGTKQITLSNAKKDEETGQVAGQAAAKVVVRIHKDYFGSSEITNN